MNLYVRFFLLLIKRAFKYKKIHLFDLCETNFIVNVLDLDTNLHVNNGRYLSIMDLGRVDLMLKSGAFWVLIRKGFLPVLTSQSIRFKRSLKLFDRFTVSTHIEGWDEKDFYISQKFIKNGTVYAEGLIKGRFIKIGQKGSVSTTDVFEILGESFTEEKHTKRTELQKKIESMLVKEPK